MPTLPNEILDIIVEELLVAGRGPWRGLLRDVKACCLVSRSFVHRCQKRIFYKINLRPRRFPSRSSSRSNPNYTVTFSQLLRTSPHLARYVKVLEYTSCEPEDGSSMDIIQALKMLQHVTEFHINMKQDDHESSFNEYAPSLQEAIISIATNPNLQSLTVDGGKHFPFDIDDLHSFRPHRLHFIHTQTGSMTRLCLLRCPEEREGDENRDAIGIGKPHCVKSLKYEAKTFSAINVIMNPTPPDWLRMPPFSLSELESLDISIDHSLDIISAFILLSQQRCLQSLVFDVTKHELTIGTFLMPLQHLNPASHNTLRHLSLTLTEYLWVQWTFDDPYQGFCDPGSLLANLTELEHLEITLSLHYKLNYHQWNFGEQWGALVRLLAPAGRPTRFTKLKEVTVLVVAHATEGEVPSADEWAEDENHLVEGIQDFVYPVYFSGLRKLPDVKLSLRTEVRCA